MIARDLDLIRQLAELLPEANAALERLAAIRYPGADVARGTVDNIAAFVDHLRLIMAAEGNPDDYDRLWEERYEERYAG